MSGWRFHAQARSRLRVVGPASIQAQSLLIVREVAVSGAIP
ncbi:hypothetical protein [Laspinema palackyanum]